MVENLLYSGFRYPHHDENSGYDNVVVSPANYVNGGTLLWGNAPIGTFRRRINFVLIDIATVIRSWRYPYVLLFYPEHTAYISPAVLRLLKKKVTCVLHLGPEFWFDSKGSIAVALKRANVRMADQLIVLSSAQYQYCTKRFPGRVAWIPHGVWCDEKPIDGSMVPVRPRRISIVGNTYRDYETIIEVVRLIERSHPSITFDLVGVKPEKLSLIAKNKNVVFHKRLSPEQYRSTIEQSLFMLLPLRFATANNALLESMSFGVPVYCSDVEGVKDYLISEEYVFRHSKEVIGILDRRLQQSHADAVRERTALKRYARERFGWEKIRNDVIQRATG